MTQKTCFGYKSTGRRCRASEVALDLGIVGRKAIICASSKGLGRACALALAEAGCEILVNGRDPVKLARAASEIRETAGVSVREVAGDLNDPATRAALIAACPDADILVNNNSGPSFKTFEAIARDQRKFGRIVNITSASVRAPIAGLEVSSGARAGLTAFLASAARAHVRDNVTINSIKPGAFDTDRQRSAIERAAGQRGISLEAARAEAQARSSARRFGDPANLAPSVPFWLAQGPASSPVRTS